MEFVEDSFNKSDRPLPAPPPGRRRLALGSLVTVGLSALLVVYLLVPSALYALQGGRPQELGPLASASLDEVEGWVSATGTPEKTALSFTRFGTRGSFRLTRAQDRHEVWLLFQVPANFEGEFVPPTHFVGRLRRFTESGLLPAEVLSALASKPNRSENEFLLVDGDSPASQKPSLYAAILLALVAAACLSSACFLWRDIKSPSRKS